MRTHIADADYFKVSDHDLRLPVLGLMKFAMYDADEGGEDIYIMYFKKKDYIEADKELDEPSTCPYCFSEIKLSGLEQTLGISFSSKVTKKINKLKKWLILQDALLSQIQSTNREVKL